MCAPPPFPAPPLLCHMRTPHPLPRDPANLCLALSSGERDNAKIFYIFIFVASAFTGALLAAPIEALLAPAEVRGGEWTGEGGLQSLNV